MFESIRRGALDLADKPEHDDVAAEARLRSLVRELSQVPVVRHVKGTLGAARVWGGRTEGHASRPPLAGQVPIVAIGASAGGPLAVAAVLGGLPAAFPAAVALVQHPP